MPRRNLLAIFLVAVVSLFCYLQVDRNPYGRYLSQVLTTIEQKALEPPPPHELFEGAMQGIIAELDEYSAYIGAVDTEEFQAELEQQFGGVGVMITLEAPADDPEGPKQLRVVNPPLFGTPARQAGIRAGDMIVEIDGQPVAGRSMKEIIQLMRGPVGAPVVLTVQQDNQDEPVDLTLERATIRVPSVLGDRRLAEGGWDFRREQDPRIAYLRITQFGEKTADELAAVLEELEPPSVEALILDLRDNPGGLLDAAVETCDLFIPGGLPIVSIKGRGEVIEREYFSSGAGGWLDVPIVVLVNHYSASASEIVAACLQDHDRAVVVGTRTWGKGTVQHVIPVENGKSLLKLTAASYWRPSGKNIHRMSDDEEDDAWGVVPNEGFVAELTDEQFKRLHEYRAARDIFAPKTAQPTPDPSTSVAPPDDDQTPADPQLQKAVDYLEEQLDQTTAQPEAG